MPRFFVPSLEPERITVDGADGLHLAKALRVRPGEKLTLCDGKGTDAECEVSAVYSGAVGLSVLRRYPNTTEPRLRLHLYQGFPKGDKFELILQKAVELGVAEITPVFTERCVSKPDAKAQENRLTRFRRIAAEAAGQSERGVIPQVNGFLTYREAIERCQKPGVLFYEKGGVGLSTLRDTLTSSDAFSVFIGPEGGLEPTEAELAEHAGILPASLGPRILRTETAGLAAAAALLLMSGDL